MGITDTINSWVLASEHHGQKYVIDNYDKYRKISYIIFGLITIVFITGNRWDIACVLLLVMHVHTLTNQIWHKLRNIEAAMDQRHKNEKQKNDIL